MAYTRYSIYAVARKNCTKTLKFLKQNHNLRWFSLRSRRVTRLP